MPIAQNREDGGRSVREAWIYWARKQRNPKPSWLVPWEQLAESDKEADRVIWDEVVAPYATMIAQLVKQNNHLGDIVSRLQNRLDGIDPDENDLIQQGYHDFSNTLDVD